MDIEKKVGANIRKFRRQREWSQEELALEANLHRAYIGQIERGDKIIGIKNLEIIANALGITVDRLVK